MSVNFATLQALDIPEGKVVQITDASGRVIWAVGGGKVILQVEKITSNTYAAETTYQNEQFILLDIYPKTNGTVKVTYGGLTKTITDTSGAAEPNAQQVFFGTFNGVSDSVTTPSSGELTIEGKFMAFACAKYKNQDKNYDNMTCSCITAVEEWGDLTSIGKNAFLDCKNLVLTSLPNGITSIGDSAFSGCTSLALTSLPSSLKNIGEYAFQNCFGLQFGDNFFSEGLVSIGDFAFELNPEGGETFVQSFAITIPSTVIKIGAAAFEGPIIDAKSYTYFYRITVLATTPPEYLTDSTYSLFSEVYTSSNFSIIVPKGCGAAYKAAVGWSKYANYIVEAT